MAAPGAQGPQNGSRAVFGSQEAVFGAVFLDYIKRVTALQASLDYQSQPTTGKSPKKSPEESSYRRNHGSVIVIRFIAMIKYPFAVSHIAALVAHCRGPQSQLRQ